MSRDAARRWRPGQRSFCSVAASKVFFNTHTYGTRSPPIRDPPSLFRCPMPSLDLSNDMVQRACPVSTGAVDTVGGLRTAFFCALTAHRSPSSGSKQAFLFRRDRRVGARKLWAKRRGRLVGGSFHAGGRRGKHVKGGVLVCAVVRPVER